jgi:hypothetical protein
MGEIVAALFEGNWYRARVVVADPEAERVKVFFVDYGNTEDLHERMVRPMTARFMHLPFQAVECFLPLQPVGTEWSEEAKERFSQLAEGRILIAQIVARLDVALYLPLHFSPTCSFFLQVLWHHDS